MHYKVQCQQISSFWQYLGKLRATLWPSSSWGWMLPEHWWWILVWIQITPFSNSVCRASRGHVFFRFFRDLYIETLCLHPSWFREIIYMGTKGLPTKYCFMFNNYSFSLKRIFWDCGRYVYKFWSTTGHRCITYRSAAWCRFPKWSEVRDDLPPQKGLVNRM